MVCSGSAQASFVITRRIPSFTILIPVFTAWLITIITPQIIHRHPANSLSNTLIIS
ncbi:hypothetical protein BDR03DRAFT_938518 [Suillus americanus]|nr:hypothetical protein BDR03DRAFT_938518 [Suillus americanus]